jgi:hypothetical protein
MVPAFRFDGMPACRSRPARPSRPHERILCDDGRIKMIGVPMRCRVLPFLATATLLASPARQAPHAAWRTIRTAHYRIHYPLVLSDWAQDVASRVEGIHGAVVKLVGYESPKPIQVVLMDPMEEANGFTVPFLPYPFVILWRTQPDSDQLHAGALSDWTEDLVAHEFTHIHHLMRPKNRPNLMDRLSGLPLGPLVLKAPRWVIEGYATLAEGRLTGSGRPHSATRAAVLRQWALQGKLPEYEALNDSQALYGGHMAYLAGSAYLEWLERQRPQTPDILPRLWKQLASRRDRDFDAAFRATFGFDPKDGYHRFRAELDHDALEWEHRVKAEGVREGEIWMRAEGTLSDLAVSPDGKRLLAFARDRRSPGLRVWKLKEDPKKDPRKEASDPNEVEDVAPEFPGRTLLSALPMLDFRVPDRPEWIDDRTVKFMLKRRDEEGIQKRQPALWHLSGGVDAHPSNLPAGHWTILKPVHRDGRWILEYQGRVVPLPGQAAGRAIVDGNQLYAACEWDGTWNLVRVPVTASGFGEVQRLTRTLSAVWNPAPTPDGKELYFTRLDARGFEIRKLDLTLAPLSAPVAVPEARMLNAGTLLPPAVEPDPLPPPGPVPPSEPYRSLDNLWNASATGWTLCPAGKSLQFGFSGADLLDRLAWQALVSAGSDGGPSGAAGGISYGGWAWKPSLTVFLAREKPSAQQYLHPEGLDRERRGAEFSFTYENLSDHPFRCEPVVAWERDEALPAKSIALTRE